MDVCGEYVVGGVEGVWCGELAVGMGIKSIVVASGVGVVWGSGVCGLCDNLSCVGVDIGLVVGCYDTRHTRPAVN